MQLDCIILLETCCLLNIHFVQTPDYLGKRNTQTSMPLKEKALGEGSPNVNNIWRKKLHFVKRLECTTLRGYVLMEKQSSALCFCTAFDQMDPPIFNLGEWTLMFCLKNQSMMVRCWSCKPKNMSSVPTHAYKGISMSLFPEKNPDMLLWSGLNNFYK